MDCLYLAKKRAIFLDRDGTINVDEGFTHKPEELVFQTHAIEGLQLLSSLDFLLIVVTNQSGIGRGFYTEEQFHLFMEKMKNELRKAEVSFDEIYFCPHHPDKTPPCTCRKPKTGLVQKAMRDFARRGVQIDLSCSFIIGDRQADGQMAHAAGCKAVRVGNHLEQEPFAWDYQAKNLLDAARWIASKTFFPYTLPRFG